MTSVQRKFAVGLVTLFIVLSASYTGQTTKRTPNGCDGDSNLTTNLQDCLKGKGVKSEVCITQNKIEVVLTDHKETPVDCNVIMAIRYCVLQYAKNSGPRYEVTIAVAPSTPGAPAHEVYKGHVGTGKDPDSMPPCNIDVLDLKAKGTLSINLCKVERKVSEDAKRLGVRIENLNVKIKKSEGGKLYLEVSGKFRASEVSESQVRVMVKGLVNNYTGTQSINTDKLVVYTRSDKNSRVK